MGSGASLSLHAFYVHDPLQVDNHEAGDAVGSAPTVAGVDGCNVRARGVHIWKQGKEMDENVAMQSSIGGELKVLT